MIADTEQKRQYRLAKRDNPNLTEEEFLNSAEQTEYTNSQDKTESDKIVEQDELVGKEPVVENPDNEVGQAGAKLAVEKDAEPDIMTFDGVVEQKKKDDDSTKSLIESVSTNTITPEQQEEAKTELQSAYDELKRLKDEAKKGMEPSKWGMPATIISAVLTAATGGAVPFIPFINLNGDSQKIAYLNKLDALYAENLQNLQSKKIENKINADKTIQEQAVEAGKTKVAEEGEYAKSGIRKDEAKFAGEVQNRLLALSADLRNKSPAESSRYVQEFLDTMSPAERKEFFKYKKLFNKDMTDTEYTLEMVGKGVDNTAGKAAGIVRDVMSGVKK